MESSEPSRSGSFFSIDMLLSAIVCQQGGAVYYVRFEGSNATPPKQPQRRDSRASEGAPRPAAPVGRSVVDGFSSKADSCCYSVPVERTEDIVWVSGGQRQRRIGCALQTD
jgi:hypothetical protein